MKITTTTLRDFRISFGETVKSLEEKHGITIEIGNITYEADGSGFRFKAEVTNGTPDEAKKVQFERELNTYSYRFDALTPEMYGMKIDDPKLGECKLVAIKPRARKFPMVIEQVSTGRRYRTTYDAIKRSLNLTERAVKGEIK